MSAAPAELRGRTRIADRVLERIAARALDEVDQAGGVTRRLLGVPLGRGKGQSAPQVRARVQGELATLQLTMSVVYPAPVRQVTGQVREHVRSRVRELTGLAVRQLDIEVAGLVPPAGGRRVQ